MGHNAIASSGFVGKSNQQCISHFSFYNRALKNRVREDIEGQVSSIFPPKEKRAVCTEFLSQSRWFYIQTWCNDRRGKCSLYRVFPGASCPLTKSSYWTLRQCIPHSELSSIALLFCQCLGWNMLQIHCGISKSDWLENWRFRQNPSFQIQEKWPPQLLACLHLSSTWRKILLVWISQQRSIHCTLDFYVEPWFTWEDSCISLS